MRIIPNKQNNALLIFATPEEESSVESMLHKIDIIPLQVRIDATIAEVDLNDALEYGTQFYFRNLGLSSGGITGGTVTTGASGSTPASTTTTPTTLNLSNLFAGGTSVGSGFPGFLLSKTDTDVQYALAALQAVTNVRVLSSPQLVVLDNQPAKLLVGQSVPIENGTLTGVGTSSTLTTSTSITYQQTGVIMQILPHVNSSGLVTMDIAQEVSSVGSGATTTTPTFNDRQVTTRVAVQDGQTVGIAGLITDQVSEGNDGLPYLKDLPILGPLFGQQTNTRTRDELLVMITPHIIRDQRDARALTDDLRDTLPHAGLVPQELQALPFSGSSNPQGDLSR
jgi:general secretion pathway protein D